VRAARSYAVRLSAGTTSLFTDIAGSTELAARIGDAAWAELLERHHAAVRAQLEAFAGREMDTAGDGFFAIFDDVRGALSAAAGIRAAVRALGLAVRFGVHTGDCYVVDDKCTGLAIHICARIVALAEPDEVLVSQAVRDAAGPGFDFVARGTHELRGIPGEWSLSALVNGS
jgi:class 3 adenylate cyclase